MGGACAKVLTPFSGCFAGGVAPIAGFAAVPRFFGPVVMPFAGTTPWPVNIAAWLVAAIVGLP